MSRLLIAAGQVTAILAVAFFLLWLLRSRAAGLRHGVLMIAMGCAAILPLLDAIAPPWPIDPIPVPVIFATPFAAAPPRAAAPVQTGRPDEAAAAPVQGPPPRVEDIRSPPVSAAASVRFERWRGGLPHVLDAVWIAYLAGVVAALLMLLAGLLRLRRMAAGARPVTNAAWQREAAAIAADYRLGRPIRLVQGPGARMPLTWGVVRPLVLLPEAVDWPEERIRAVLLHELAHIRRNDWLVQLLAGVLRAVYWFNPLVWLACARLRLESERACDDAVIGHGVNRTAYAAQLLALARAVNPRMPDGLPAASMARPSTLRRRIGGILDPATVRGGAHPASLAGWAAVLLLATGVIVACSGVSIADGGEAGVPAGQPGRAALADPGSGDPVAESLPEPTAETFAHDARAAAPPLEGDRPLQVSTSAEPVRIAHAGSSSPRAVVAGILDLVRSALTDDPAPSLDELTYPITGLRHVQRHAEAVLEEGRSSPAELAANFIEIINALGNTANLAANIASRPRGAQVPSTRFEQLAVALRQGAVELTDALMPVTDAASTVPATPEHRAVVAAMDLAQRTRRDAALVGPRQQSWLLTQLDTLERAARSAAGDTGNDRMRLHLLMSAVRSTAMQATQISRRADARAEVRDKAIDLAGALHDVHGRLEMALSFPSPSLPGGDPIASMLAKIPTQVPGLRLATLRRSGDVMVASLGGPGSTPVNVVIEEAPTEVDAIRKEDWSIVSTPVTGLMQERDGIRLHVWGGEGSASGFRVLTRVGTTVVNVSAAPELSRFVLPVLDGIVQQLR